MKRASIARARQIRQATRSAREGRTVPRTPIVSLPNQPCADSCGARPLHRSLCAVIACVLGSPILHAAEVAGPGCPVGVVACPDKPVDFSMCPKGDLLDFFVPGLPTSGDREGAPTDFAARTVQAHGESWSVFTGDAEIRRLDQLLRADTIRYDSTTTAYEANGNVRYQDRGILLSADRASGRTEPQQGQLEGVRFQLLDSRGNGRAAVADMTDPEHVELGQPSYTTCTLADPQWEFRAADMTLDQEEGIGRAHDLTFRVGDVPVFWLPYARFPLDDRRVTGFLYPTLGFSDDRGLDLTTPYYLNLAPNYDATLYPRLMTRRGFMLGGEFRYLTEGSRGTLEFTYLPDDREADRDRGSFRWQDWTTFNANWGATINLNHVSDDRYFEDFGRSLYSSATSLLPSSAYLRGRGGWWTASFGADAYQITDPTLPDQFEPYRRLPRATFAGERALGGGFDWGLDSEFVAFSKDDALDGQRLDLYPYLAYPIETAAYFVRPQLGYRYTTYSLDRSDASSPNRGVPIFSLDAGLTFERSLQIGDGAWTQTLEPRVYYLRVPYRDQDDLPIFDTQEIPFSFGELFRSNRFVGADRQMDANNLTLALTSRLIEDASGEERVSASIGQIRYFDEQRVQLPNRPETDFSGSTYVAGLDLRLTPRWRLTLDQQWNPNSDRTDLAAIGVQNRFGSDGVFNFSYRFRRDFLEQVDASVLLPITPAWRLIARGNYSLRDDKTLEGFLGIEHDTCCVAWRVLARHWVRTIEGEADNALYFEIEFKGLGSIGRKADDFLRRGILGYR